MSNGKSHCGSKSNLHDWASSGVDEMLKMKSRKGMRLPIDLTAICNYDKPGGWKKPDEILGRPLTGSSCYGCPGSSSGFENSFAGWQSGRGSCSGTQNLVANAVRGWLNSPGHRAAMLSENNWKNIKWTRLGAAIITECTNRGTNEEEFQYWANSWFSGLP